MQQSQAQPAGPGEGLAPVEDPGQHPDPIGALAALCVIARFHHIAADPATLAHQLGLRPSEAVAASDLLQAARHLGLKARLSRTTIGRLALSPCPPWPCCAGRAAKCAPWCWPNATASACSCKTPALRARSPAPSSNPWTP
ncbi:MAG: cysteine peptidase family C39 domain-containing protein, partial [Giesbergeria sp.]